MLKESLAFIRSRGSKTFLVMDEIVGVWMAPNFISPNNFDSLVDGLTPLDNALADKEALQAVAAGGLDDVLADWHDDSVLTLKMGRLAFAGTDKKLLWSKLSANGGSRADIATEGRDIESAWKSSDVLWKPKNALTLAIFTAHRTLATAKFEGLNAAENASDVARGALHMQGNEVWDLCVKWYEMATANFGPATAEGMLIRTIPTTYNPLTVPGQLQFTEVISLAPNQLKLVWDAPRGEHFNVQAKPPGAAGFAPFLINTTEKEWMGMGMAPGLWAFRGDATNAAGPGEMSGIITVQVVAANAA